MKREFTVSTYIFFESKVFLLLHKKFQKWMPPGGHLHPNELPFDGALREVKEECGLEIELFSQENILVSTHCAKTTPRPYLILEEKLEDHMHIDCIYVAKAKSDQFKLNFEECLNGKWFTLEQIKALDSKTIFEDSIIVLEHLFATLFEKSMV